jgi:GDPmannose 4,6-dehydratase
MFGKVAQVPQNEGTPFHPRSPYAVAKVYGYWITRNYREAYGMHATNGILFNHESPRRGENFVTRKITLGVGEILRGDRETIALGNLEARRDWGFARDYMEGAWLMLQQEEPDDYVLATHETHSVQEFLEESFEYAGLDWRKHVTTDARFLRPAEVDVLIGDYSKAKDQLGWEPKVRFRELVRMMVDADR